MAERIRERTHNCRYVRGFRVTQRPVFASATAFSQSGALRGIEGDAVVLDLSPREDREMAKEPEWPMAGSVTIEYTTSPAGGLPRLGWTFSTDPQLDARLAITLLRDIASELEIDPPHDAESP